MKTTFLLLALAAGTISAQAHAGEAVSQAEIRELVKRGTILPLEILLARFPPKEFGKLLDLEVEREHGKVIYEFEFLRADGVVIEVKVDAGDGRVLEREIGD